MSCTQATFHSDERSFVRQAFQPEHDSQTRSKADRQMSTKRLAVISIAALVFAVYETWVAYASQLEASDVFWAVFAWGCLLFVVGLRYESLRGK